MVRKGSIKEKIICGLAYPLRWGMQVTYDILKVFPVRNRICFFSRQSDKVTRDFSLLQEELSRVSPGTEQKTICHRFRDIHDGAFGFMVDQLKSMYYLATSKVCVLDAYWPSVCMLRHRKDLMVIQIWHSIGKIKRSGYQTLDMASGRSSSLAKAVRMHKNYTYIISGGSGWTESYCEAFDVGSDKLRSFGLPRLDWLIGLPDTRQELEHRFPEIKGKKLVLYAPTYRKYPVSTYIDLKEAFEDDEFALICKYHPNQVFDEAIPADVRKYSNEDIFVLMRACDYIVTDYSSLALEAAAIGKKTYYYLFDHDRYMRDNGLNIDPKFEMPTCTFERAKDLYQAISSGSYDYEELQRFKEKYLPDDLGHSTDKIVSLIKEIMEKNQ